MRRSLGWAAIVALTVLIPVLAERRRSTARIPVDVSFIRADSVHLTLTAAGTLTPAVVADVGSRIIGTLVELRVIEGQAVSRGMVLGRVAPEAGVSLRESARASSLGAESRVASAVASLLHAERALKRLRDIAAGATNGPLVSAQEIEAAETAVSLARADLDAARAGRVAAAAAASEADNAEQRVLMIAPFDGVVTRIHRRIGETVVPATYGGESGRVLTVAKPDLGQVSINVPERYALQLDTGDAVRASLLADPTRPLRMSVGHVRPRRLPDGDLSGFEAGFIVESGQGALPWGATVLVRVRVVAMRAELVLPLAALVPDPDDAAGVGVFVLTDGYARYHRVRVSQYGDETASLDDGPPAGSVVIIPPTDGVTVIHDGSRVQRNRAASPSPQQSVDAP